MLKDVGVACQKVYKQGRDNIGVKVKLPHPCIVFTHIQDMCLEQLDTEFIRICWVIQHQYGVSYMCDKQLHAKGNEIPCDSIIRLILLFHRNLLFWWLHKMATPSVSLFCCGTEAVYSREIQRTETASCLLFKTTTSMETSECMMIDHWPWSYLYDISVPSWHITGLMQCRGMNTVSSIAHIVYKNPPKPYFQLYIHAFCNGSSCATKSAQIKLSNWAHYLLNNDTEKAAGLLYIDCKSGLNLDKSDSVYVSQWLWSSSHS